MTWPAGMRVRDRMTRGVVTIRPELRVTDAAALMRSHRIRRPPVVRRGRRLIGIVTDRDLRRVVFDLAIQGRF